MKSEVLFFLTKKRAKRAVRSKIAAKNLPPQKVFTNGAEPPKMWAKNFYFAPASSPDVIATIPNAIGLVFTFLNPASENIFSTSVRLG